MKMTNACPDSRIGLNLNVVTRVATMAARLFRWRPSFHRADQSGRETPTLGIVHYMSLFLLISLLGACDAGTESLTGTDFNPTNRSSGAAVLVAPSDAEVPVGESLQFEAEVLDESGRELDDVELIWTSSDSSVATVNDDGVAEGLLDGSVQITAGVKGGPNNSVWLDVKSQGNRTLELTPSEAQMQVGDSVQFEVELLNNGGNAVDDSEIVWSSSDSAVATVHPDGLAVGVAEGSVEITATADDVETSAALTVAANADPASVEPAPASVDVAPSQTEVTEGATVQFDATVLDGDGNVMEDVVVTWSSSDPAIATVDDAGLATGVADGSVDITATADSVETSAALTVAAEEDSSSSPEPTPASVDVAPSQTEVTEGGTVQFDATVLDGDGNVMEDVGVTWSSSNPAIATVDVQGLAEGLAEGGADIIAQTEDGVSGKAALWVESASSSSDPVEVEEPELPRSQVTVQLPSVDRTVRVTSEAELQAAFEDVRPGDEIVLSRDRVWGQITLPDHGGDWAILRGEGDVPPAGTRITPEHDVTRVQHGSNGGIINASNVEGWYVYGLKAETTGEIQEGLVVQNSSRIVLDRVWVWAPGDAGSLAIRRGVRLNGEDVALVNSRVEGIIRSGYQSQGVGIWDGGGPFRIENNFIEALNQNFLAGGASPSSLAKNPSDGTIRNNHLYTRPAWANKTGTIMVLEWKAGERWLVEGNVVENDYTGFTVAVKAPEAGQGIDGQRTGDITLRRNRYIGDFEGTGGYMLLRGASHPHTVDAGTFLLEDEWWEDQRSGRAIRLLGAPDNVTIRRTTIFGTHSSLEIVGEAPAGETANVAIDRYRSRTGRYGLWMTDADFANGFSDAYAGHALADYWQYWADDGSNYCSSNSHIPDTLDQSAQDEFFCTQFEQDIPATVGADEARVESATSGVRDSFLP